jgi:transposase-like protein
MRNDHLRGAPEFDGVAGTPTHCPNCRSQDLKTTSKVVNAATYWRCVACGEVWNVARLRAGSRYAPYRPGGR